MSQVATGTQWRDPDTGKLMGVAASRDTNSFPIKLGSQFSGPDHQRTVVEAPAPVPPTLEPASDVEDADAVDLEIRHWRKVLQVGGPKSLEALGRLRALAHREYARPEVRRRLTGLLASCGVGRPRE